MPARKMVRTMDMKYDPPLRHNARGRGITRRRLLSAGAVTGGGLALAACGLGGATPNPPAAPSASGEVSVVYYVYNETVNARMLRHEAALAKAVPSVKVTMIPVSGMLLAKLQTMTAGGTPPD